MTTLRRSVLARRAAALTVLAWSAVFAGSLLAAAALTPFVHSALGAFGLPESWRFPRVFSRVAMAAALATLIGFRRWTGWRELEALLGRSSAGGAAAEALAGLAAALAAVATGVAWAFAFGYLGPGEAPFDFAAARLLKLMAGCAMVALIEEVFFRGLMLGSFTARWRWTTAALVSSGLYSAVHLLSADRRFTLSGFEASSGFHYLGHVLTGQLETAALPPLAGLFLMGLVLALVVRRTGSLWIAVGLHAGLAVSFQVLRQSTHVVAEIPGTSALATIHYLAGTPWAWASIVLAGGLVFLGAAFDERRRAARSRLAAE